MDALYNLFPNFDRFLLVFVPALFGIICHEVAHGYAALLQGDQTARSLGRLTLNPLKHLDASGTLFFLLTALFTPFVFGWAKPVPIQPRFFKRPREGMMLVALAGPLANFLVAFLCALIVGILTGLAGPGSATFSEPLYYVALSAQAGVLINCMLAWFNLMPIPPLDGSHILEGLLPDALARQYARLGRYGFLILIGFIYFGLLGRILWPLIQASAQFITRLAGFFFSFPAVF